MKVNTTKTLRRHCLKKIPLIKRFIWTQKIQGLQNQGKEPILVRSIVKKTKEKVRLGFCKLWLTKNYFIIHVLWSNILLKKSSKFIKKCQHQNKLLSNNAQDSKN